MLQWGRGFAATEGRRGRRAWRDTHGFNGAVALQPRKVPRPGTRPSMSRCFNGAVALQPRKVDTYGASGYPASTLQWGRGFAATEGGSSEVISQQGPRVPFASTPAFLSLLPSFRIITVSVNRYIAAN